MKVELTIDNIISYYNMIPDYTNKISNNVGLVRLSNIIYKEMLLYFYGTVTEKHIEKPVKSLNGAYIKLREEYKEKMYYDVNIIEFTKMYPHIICKLNERKQLSFSPTELGDLYSFITYNYKEINTNIRLKPHAKKTHHFLLHYMYALGANPYLFNYTFSNHGLIMDYTKETFHYIYTHYENIIYVDTDSIYYIDDGKKICDYIDWLEIPYTIDTTMVYFYKLMKYIELYNGKIHIRGLKSNRNGKMPPYATDMNDNINKMNNKIRELKLKNLLGI